MPPSNPYIGARPFRRNERIYGRTREARDLLSTLVGDRIVLLNSPSGAGKSSLIQAAIIPTLERRRFVVRPTIRVNAEAPLAGANRYLLSVMQSLEEARPEAEQLAPAQMAGLTLDAYLQQRAGADAKHGQVLIFDQFEEVLTLDPTDEPARLEFFTQLGDALADPWRWALFAIREEYVAALEPYLHLVPTRFANTFRLELLSVAAAVEAIRGPASDRHGVTFAEGVAEGLAGDLARIIVQDAQDNRVERAGSTVEPVQLQVVCYRLWEKRFPDAADPQGQTISAADVQAHGRVDNALQEFYDSGVTKSVARGQVSERAVRRWIDTQLITRQGFRSQVLAGNEADFGLNKPTVEELTNAYVVRVERRGASRIELAHDRLVGPARASNQQWFATHLSPLQRQAEVWAAQGQPASLLFSAADLDAAEAWAAANQAGLTADERLFLEKCREERRRAEERARQARRIRNLAIGASIAAVLAVVAFVAALGFFNQANANYLKAEANRVKAEENGQTAVANQSIAETQQALAVANEQRAVAQQATAESSARVSRARELAAAAKTQLDIDPELSLLLGLRAIGATRDDDPAVADAAAALQQAAQAARARARLIPDGSQIFGVAYSPDDSLLATAGFTSTVHLLDPASGAEIRALSAGENRFLLGLDFSPDGRRLIAGGDDQIIYAFQVADGTPLGTSQPLGGAIVAARYSPSGDRIAVGTTASQAWLLDAATLAPVGEPLPFDRAAVDVAFSPDGSLLAVPVPGGAVDLWRVADGAQVGALQQPTSNSVQAVAFSADGSMLAVGGRDQRARIWDVATRSLAHEYRGHSDSIFKVAFGPDDAYLITASADSTIRLWNISGETPMLTLAGHSGQVRGISLRHDGNMLASASADTTVRQWSLGLIQGQQLRALAYSPDGATLATAGDDGLVQLWDAAGERHLRTLGGAAGGIQTIAFSPDGRSLIGGDAAGLALIWDVAAGGAPRLLDGHSAGVNSVALSPSAPLAASAGDDGTVRLWDTLRATEVYSFTTGAGRVTSVAFSPDGSLIAAGDANGLLSVWKTQGYGEYAQIDEPNQRRILAIAFSPDGAHIAIAGDDPVAYIFPLDGGEPVALEGHTGAINAIAFSHSGARVASAGADNTLRLWDAASGAPDSFTLPVISSPRSIAFSPDDAWLAAIATGSSAADRYPLSRQSLIDLARQRLTRGFTDQECVTYAIEDPCP